MSRYDGFAAAGGDADADIGDLLVDERGWAVCESRLVIKCRVSRIANNTVQFGDGAQIGPQLA